MLFAVAHLLLEIVFLLLQLLDSLGLHLVLSYFFLELLQFLGVVGQRFLLGLLVALP